ncbi:11462_t:CDS:2 [Acaulospora morrowiae]|uniref:11462_t:CDS:1 n=1 Tax=Acaulospora morrowiae TaxID=94023 RepID=A0A9N9BJT1_9GLOM|nr:11462_t:CDS:2 [Acaulospora morrowiae]
MRMENRGSEMQFNQSISGAKRRLYMSLNNQLARLQQNMMTMEQNVEVTSDQVRCIQSLGTAHGALFMAANRVLRTDSREEKF